MDRVRVGLTGLGVVFLLTLGVSLMFGRPDSSPEVAESAKEPGEPLAQLGVAPSTEPKLVVPPSAPNGYVPPSAPDGYVPPEAAEGATAPSESPVRTPPGEPAVETTIAI